MIRTVGQLAGRLAALPQDAAIELNVNGVKVEILSIYSEQPVFRAGILVESHGTIYVDLGADDE